jgi:iron complex transport system ATP-binding protein
LARGAELERMTAALNPALALDGASVRLGGRLVLDGASFSVAAGELVGVLGPNGAGKTTLLRAALGGLKLDAGTARLTGRDVTGLSEPERARLVGYLPQERRVAWSLPAWRIAALGAVDRPPAEARAAAFEALDRVGLANLAERGVLEMSGGERARVLVARLLATRTPLLVADEPIAGLDPDAQLLVLDLLRQETTANRAVVATLHDLTLAARACDRLVIMNHGRVVAAGAPREALTSEVLEEVFGLAGELVETAAGPVLAARRVAKASYGIGPSP